MVVQQSLVIIKPDGLVKSLTGNIITALSETKLKIVGAKILKVSRELAEKHYEHLKSKPFFNELIDYIMGKYHTDRVLALVYHGEEAINKIREICGATNPEEASPISIRGKYGRINSKTKVFENVIHASDTEENAKREIQLWFSPSELTEIIYPIKTEFLTSPKLVWA
ncbi:MAG: nucleoside-diphosphate kinase [Candidatus Pacearchaeota archaeon]|nr:nucleoside-diphosphate kinase [Candidatus Pacearchaeota archaeon]